MLDGSDGFEPGTYGRSFADVYDLWYADASDPTPVVEFVGRFGTRLRILELGVGSGRLAGPLSAAGHELIGLDVSAEMLDRRERGDDFAAVRADMRVLPVADRSVDLVLVAYNTLFNLLTAEAQEACIGEAARCLRPAGRLVLEAYVPTPPDPGLDRLVSTHSIALDRVVLTATIRDPDRQLITGQHIDITEAGIRLRPWRVRYAPPSELDGMARSAGLALDQRYSGWARGPFDERSDRHVSVYSRSEA